MNKIILVVFCFLLTACGFQLRGTAILPFETLYISGPPGHPMGTDLKRLIRAGTNTRIVDKAKDAQAILEIISVTNDRQIMSVSGGGRVREFELRYRVSFRLKDAKGMDIIPVNEIVLHRVLPFTDAQVVGKEGEEALLVREMHRDSADQIVRRMAAVKIAEVKESPL
ncbi:LPS-assembly lipoprotein LptE [Nitrosovibrio sp. Nv4]|uniref:LPS-assembly lipoprotein LptE n=1 Tax=Nitrosovibrio sp. Nv4 TaxID=1945880 RepID=UPI000BC88487|nr:LPS assembly lipoprotein LptE [Nitrosovibrio sp. Nv4]SOD40711.1 LPS-assembly lipoprotein [Nitrosovibrio sp. Nv4]